MAFVLSLPLEHGDHGDCIIALDEAAGVLGERQPGIEIDLALAQNAGGFVEGDNAVAVITVLERER